jgi:serine/threonine-protein kinase
MDGDPFGLLGTVLDGKFRVDSLVGDGDLSVVYKGHHLEIDAPVAIKCLHLPDTLDPALTRPVVEAFEESGRLHDRLGRGSPQVAQTIAVGQTIAPRNGTTVPYRIREWFEGESLASELARRRRRGDRPRTVEQAFALLAPAIDGIAHAHDEGIAHLSLDPSNLFLARDEGRYSLKVLDFGAARAGHRADARPTLDSELTRGLHLLHPAYAAPEQLDMDLGEPGTWTDVYALALITMEVLAERSGMEGRDTAALVNRATDSQRRPTPQAHGLKLPRALDLVLTRAVARRPDERQKDARVFLNELKAAVSQSGPPKAPPSRVAPPFAPPPLPSKAAQPLPQKPACEPPRVWTREDAPDVLDPPTPLPQTRAPEAPLLPPSAAASGPVAVASRSDHGPIAPVASPPPFLAPHADPDPARLDSKFVWLRSSSRRFRFGVGAAALVLVGIVAALFASPRARQPSATLAVAPPRTAPSLASAAPPAAAPVAPSRGTPVASRPAALPGVASGVRAASPHAAAGPSLPRFSGAAARRAINSVTRKVARCRHGRFWGNGYATIVFANDGGVDRVLVDPPFSMTVTGKCVADAFGFAHIASFAGQKGYYRFRFYVAPR